MKLYAITKGALMREEEASVSIFERGYLYGDGIFDTMRSYKGEIFRFEDHLERLNKNARALGIEWKMGAGELKNLILKTLKKNRLKDAYIRVTISRGCVTSKKAGCVGAGLGPAPLRGMDPCLTIIVRPLKRYPRHFYNKGVKILICSTRRLSPFALDGKIKSINYLNSVLAREEAERKGAFEAILLSEEGYVTEGAASNIFIVKDDNLITSPSFLGTLEGITRKVVLEIAGRLDIRTEIVPFSSHDIYTADECFLTSTGIEVMPVIMVDKRIIGAGLPGAITKHIREEFLNSVER